MRKASCGKTEQKELIGSVSKKPCYLLYFTIMNTDEYGEMVIGAKTKKAVKVFFEHYMKCTPQISGIQKTAIFDARNIKILEKGE